MHATTGIVLFWEKKLLHFYLRTSQEHLRKKCCRFAIPEIWNIPEKWHVCTT